MAQLHRLKVCSRWLFILLFSLPFFSLLADQPSPGPSIAGAAKIQLERLQSMGSTIVKDAAAEYARIAAWMGTNPAAREALAGVVQADIQWAMDSAANQAWKADGSARDWAGLFPQWQRDAAQPVSAADAAKPRIVAVGAAMSADGQLRLALRGVQIKASTSFAFLIEVPGTGKEWDYQIFTWYQDGRLTGRVSDLRSKQSLGGTGAVIAKGEVVEMSLKADSLPALGSADSIIIRAQLFEGSTQLDISPELRIIPNGVNRALELFCFLLQTGTCKTGDTIPAALAMANSWCYSVGNSQVRAQVERDIIAYLAFYDKLCAWQEEIGAPWRLAPQRLVPKLMWADRIGSAWHLIQEAMRARDTDALDLDVYREFIDRPELLAWLHDLILREKLAAPRTASTVASLEDFVHRKRWYLSTMENLVDFNKRGMYSDEDLRLARAAYDRGEYYKEYFGKKRRWDEYYWLNYQVKLYQAEGRFRGDCGDTTVVQMGVFRAAGIAPVSFQRSHPQGTAAYSHNYPGYWEPNLRRWFALQDGGVFFGIGGTRITGLPMFLYMTKPRYHHWRIREDWSQIKTGDETTSISCFYPGERTNSDRISRFHRVGMDPASFDRMLFGESTQQEGLFLDLDLVTASLTDKDSDGIADMLENDYQTSPDKADSDGDGVSDRAELELGYNPASSSSVPAGPAWVMDGLTARHEVASLQVLDRRADQEESPSDLHSVQAAVVNGMLYFSAAFDRSPGRNAASHGLLITAGGLGGPAWWLDCNQERMVLSRRQDAAGGQPERWVLQPVGGGMEWDCLDRFECALPLDFLPQGTRVVYVQYHLRTPSGAPSVKNFDYATTMQVELGAQPAVAAGRVATGQGTAPAYGTVERLTVTQEGDALQLRLVTREPPVQSLFGLHTLHIRERASGMNYWIQFWDLLGLGTFRFADGEQGKEYPAVKKNFSLRILPDGYLYSIPSKDIGSGQDYYVQVHLGGHDASGKLMHAMSSTPWQRFSSNPLPAAMQSLAAQPPLADPAGDWNQSFQPVFDQSGTRVLRKDGMLWIQVDFARAEFEKRFGLVAIYLRDPAGKKNFWIQWWGLGQFSFRVWPDGSPSRDVEVERALFDSIPVEGGMVVCIPEAALLKGGGWRRLPRLEGSVRTGAWSADGSAEGSADTGALFVLEGEGR